MFPFRYKLAILFALIVLLMLGGSLLIIQSGVTDRFEERITQELDRTCELLDDFMAQRHGMLSDNGFTLTGDTLILEMLRDQNLDRPTRNDILRDEVHPAFEFIDAIVVADSAGEITADSGPDGSFVHALRNSPVFAVTGTGESGEGLILHDNYYYQVVSTPAYRVRELLGTVFVCLRLDERFLERVRDLADVDIALMQGTDPVTTSLSVQPQALSRIFDRSAAGQTQSVALNDTPHLYRIIIGDPQFVPDYIVAKSLRNDLAFLGGLRTRALTVGTMGLLLAVLLGLLLAKGVTRPVSELTDGMTRVREGELSHRLNLSSRDEFELLAESFNTMTAGMEEKERIRGLMNKVVSEDIANEMLKGELQLGGEERVATVLFSDIRGFTTLSEGVSPSDLLHIVNRYFQHMSVCIDRHQGVIDKYIGDAVMALFGLPVATGHDARNAILAAVDMMKSLDAVNAELAGRLPHPIEIGIGINTGLVVAGNMGADDRLNYSVLGDQVNLTARVEGLTRMYRTPIILTESTARALDNEPDLPFHLRPLDTVQVKGKTGATSLYDIVQSSESLPDPAEFISRFAEAQTTLHQKDFTKALQQWSELAAAVPNDGPTAVMLARADRYNQDHQSYERENPSGTHVFRRK